MSGALCHPERSEGGHAGIGSFASLRMTALLLAVATPAAGQEVEHIADNSFLIEEAYNQEAGVVQHINNFVHEEAGDSWLYVFTQEWPLGGMRNQLSYTVPLVSPEGFGTGLGDILLNYRYQAVGNGESALHVAPRFSLVLPTGSEENGRGSGAAGIQGNLPVSYEVNDALAVHSNTGFVLDGESGALDARLGASGVLRVHPRFNVLLETAWGSDEDIVFLNPGVRWAIDAGSLQIVPGLAYTIALTSDASDASDAFFLYLSLEHPFRR
jgi:Putative MetA-pathway of phenol degradation